MLSRCTTAGCADRRIYRLGARSCRPRLWRQRLPFPRNILRSAQLADIAGGLQALGAAASAPPPEPQPPPPPADPVLRLPDQLPEVIRAAVEPLIEAIRASHKAMRASHAQQSEATDAVLRVISAARVLPVVVAAPAATVALDPVAVAGEIVTAARRALPRRRWSRPWP